MTLGLLVLTLAGWGILGYVVVRMPVTAGAQGLFYAAAFLALAGTVALVVTLYEARLGNQQSGWLRSPLATGIRFAVAADAALWLQSLRLLTVGYVVLLVAAFVVMEFVLRRGNGRG